MNLHDLVNQAMVNNGYTGLYRPQECACALDDLMPCDAPQADCMAGYKNIVTDDLLRKLTAGELTDMPDTPLTTGDWYVSDTNHQDTATENDFMNDVHAAAGGMTQAPI